MYCQSVIVLFTFFWHFRDWGLTRRRIKSCQFVVCQVKPASVFIITTIIYEICKAPNLLKINFCKAYLCLPLKMKSPEKHLHMAVKYRNKNNYLVKTMVKTKLRLMQYRFVYYFVWSQQCDDERKVHINEEKTVMIR